MCWGAGLASVKRLRQEVKLFLSCRMSHDNNSWNGSPTVLSPFPVSVINGRVVTMVCWYIVHVVLSFCWNDRSVYMSGANKIHHGSHRGCVGSASLSCSPFGALAPVRLPSTCPYVSA